MRDVVRKIAILSLLLSVVGMSSEAFAQQKLGDVISNTISSTSKFSQLEDMISYCIGGILCLVSIYKFKDCVDNPVQTPISAGLKRFIAGGMFMSLPFVAACVQHSLDKGGSMINSTDTVGLQLDPAADPNSLDTMVVNLMTDIAGPMENLLSAFSFLMAVALLMLGINRLTKRMDEGPRGPAGMGTFMTFVTSAALFSWGNMAGAFTNTLFAPANSGQSSTLASIDPNGTLGLSGTDAARINQVIQGVMLFVAIIGMIAFIRGWLVLRAFADGQQGATLAQGLTFLFGGALAINLGDFVNAFQASLGINGISFS